MSEKTALKAALEACVKAKAACDESMRRIKATKLKLTPDYSRLLKLLEKDPAVFRKACGKLLPEGTNVEDDAVVAEFLTRQACAWDQMGGISKENPVIPEPEDAAALPLSIRREYRKSIDRRRSYAKGIIREIFSWIFTIVGAVAFVFLLRTFICEPIRVDGQSMQYTLIDREYVFSSKLDYLLGDIHRGDIVICNYWDESADPTHEKGILRTNKLLGIFDEPTRFVKRVVGLPGDTVSVWNGVIYVNGQRAPEVDSMYLGTYNQLRGSDQRYHQEITLGENEYYVLGDNRGNSNDSHLIGPITRNMILGHVTNVIYPLSDMRDVTVGSADWQALDPVTDTAPEN